MCISASFRFIFFEVQLIFERFDLLSRVSIIIRGSCCVRTLQCIDFGLHVKNVCFGVYFVPFKFIPELFILFFCFSISIRALRLRFVDFEHIASVIDYEFFSSYNFDQKTP